MTINRINFLVALCLIYSSIVQAPLTTLKHFDPNPIYSANDSMMPPNSQFVDLEKARIKNETPSRKRTFGLNLTGFLQKAIRATGYTGNTQYGTISGLPQSAFELGDFRGTMNAMGLFLGRNPSNGYSIWVAQTPGVPSTSDDTGDPNDITAASITQFGLPSCLETIAYRLAGYDPTSPTFDPTDSTPSPTALAFFPPNGTVSTTCPPENPYVSSIFASSKLAQDEVYFGAFSLPIEYQQAGLRLELNFELGNYFGFTVQTGVTNMKQYYINNITTSSTSGQTNLGPYSLSALATSGTSPAPISNLYNELNIPCATAASPIASQQATFDKAISNNIYNILQPDCMGSDPLCAFNDYSWDDVRLILTAKKVFDPSRHRKGMEEDEWPDMIFVPYGWLGGTIPTAKEQDFTNILALPFGNGGHASIGGGFGMTFDFAESIEVGVEGSATHFFGKTQQKRPFPTHELQRILYPFVTDVYSKPGMNWSFSALLNAYQFIKHINFWMTYVLVEHRHDNYEICNKSIEQYFVPQVLTCRSDWRAQFLNMGMSFDIQPGLQASIVWQQPISPRNAYYPVSVLGSINFLF